MEDTEGPAKVRPRHRMVDRVAGIVELVARSQGLSLTEIARGVDAPVSSVQGLVNGLVATGYLDERDRVYRLGVAPYFINLLAGRPAMHRVTHDDLQALHADTGNTAVVAVAVGSDVVYLDYCSDEPRTAYLAERFIRRRLIRTSTGWALLADWPQRDLWAYLETLGADDAGRVEAFLAVVDQIRATDMVVLPGAADTPDIDGIAVAVRERGRVVAAVGVVGPRSSLEGRTEDIVAALRQRAAEWNGEGSTGRSAAR